MIAGARRAHDRVWRVLAGPDGVRPGLPCAELLAPLPLAALALVAVNDWWWKPRAALPPWWLGKLSDLGGVIALPLVLTAVLALVLRAAALAGARVDWTLGPARLGGALAATAAAVIATKLSPAIASAVATLLGRDARIVADARDLIVLPALLLPWWHGRRAIARVPYGRVAWIRSRSVEPSVALADVVRSGAEPAAVAALAAAVRAADAVAIERALARLRGATDRRSADPRA